MLQKNPTTLINKQRSEEKYSYQRGMSEEMDLAVLQEKAKQEIQRFEAKVDHHDHDEILFLYMSKISEEIGNLATSVLGREGFKANQEPVSDEQVSNVFADTIYQIITLAQKMDVNLEVAMKEKLQRIEAEEEQESLL